MLGVKGSGRCCTMSLTTERLQLSEHAYSPCTKSGVFFGLHFLCIGSANDVRADQQQFRRCVERDRNDSAVRDAEWLYRKRSPSAAYSGSVVDFLPRSELPTPQAESRAFALGRQHDLRQRREVDRI